MTNRFTILIIVLLISSLSGKVVGNTHSNLNRGFEVDNLRNLVDGLKSPFNQMIPGDTLLLKPGLRQNLLIRNLYGSAEKPIIIINNGGVTTINTDSYYGMSFRNSRYFRLTGQGSKDDFYGIQIDRVANGAGIGVGDLCSDFEIDHVSISNTFLGGIYAKTDPDCETPTTRDQFTQYNTIIHDNHIANVGNEGMYIGSTKYFGLTENCNGQDTLLLPSLLDGVQIYNNVVEYSAWDGIQVSSAYKNCKIYGNMVLYDSQEGYFSQMSGIMIGGGSKCDCYNNFISGGKGSGIESHGLGGYRIFNNIIVDAGRSFMPEDSSQRVYGIYVSDISIETDSSVSILFNDIINPKSDGIRFQSTQSSNNVISSNMILNPGNYDYYENGNTSNRGIDAYIMIPDSAADVKVLDNFLSRDIISAGISVIDFKLQKGSSLIDQANSDLMGVTFDFLFRERPNGDKADIGAYEYNHLIDDTLTYKGVLAAYPNPVRSLLTIEFRKKEVVPEVSLMIYNLSGKLLLKKEQNFQPEDIQEIKIQVNLLPAGIYLFSLSCGNDVQSGKFIKLD